jgi:MFS family permease
MTGHAVSQLGSSFSYIAMMAKYGELSHSSSGWAYVAVCKALPFTMFGLIIGYVIDRSNRKLLILGCDLIRFGLFLAIAWCTDLTLFFVLVFLASTFEAIYGPTFKSLITHILSAEKLLAANSLEETLRSIVSIMGIAISGLLVGVLDISTCLIIDAFTFLFSAINIVTIQNLKTHVSDTQPDSEGVVKQIVKGVKILRDHREIHFPLLLWTFIVLLVAYEGPLFFPFLTEKGWSGATTSGYVFACVSSGALLTSFFLLRARSAPVKKFLTVGCVIVVDALVLNIIVWTTNLFLMLAVSLILGVTETLFRTYSVTQIQQAIPKETVGRVFSSISMVQEPIRIFAMLASALVATTFSARTGMWIGVTLEYAIGLAIIFTAMGLRGQSTILDRT